MHLDPPRPSSTLMDKRPCRLVRVVLRVAAASEPVVGDQEMDLLGNIDRLIAVAGVVVNAGGFLFLGAQFIAYRRQQKFDALTQIHTEVGSGNFREALRCLLNSSPESLLEPEDVVVQQHIAIATGLYDLLGLRVRHGVLPTDALLESEWKILLPLWDQLRPYVEAERLRRNIPQYKEHFEWLVHQAEKYARGRGYQHPAIATSPRPVGRAPNTAPPATADVDASGHG